MTDSLKVPKDIKDQTCVPVSRPPEGFYPINLSNQTPSWLRRCQVCRPVVRSQDQIAGMESKQSQYPPKPVSRLTLRCSRSQNQKIPLSMIIINRYRRLSTSQQASRTTRETRTTTMKSLQGDSPKSILTSTNLPTGTSHNYQTQTKLPTDIDEMKIYQDALILSLLIIFLYPYHQLKLNDRLSNTPALYGLIYSLYFGKFKRQNPPPVKPVPEEITPAMSEIEGIAPLKPRRHKSCCAVITSAEQPKPIENLNLEDLQQLATADEYIEQESAMDYCYGGYKPIQIGEVLANKYTVLRKLGFGHFSTVWLCKDKDSSITQYQYVAIKIVKAAEMFSCVAQDEIKLLRCIKSADPNHPGYKHIIQMLDYFQDLSVNGYHTCISFELMGPSLLHLLVQSDYHGIHLPGVRHILNQVLKGLVYLHNTCKIIHTDIKPENILIKVKDEYIRNIVETSSRYTELGVQMPRTYVSAETWENYLYCQPPQDLNEPTDTECTLERPRARSMRTASFPNEERNIPDKLNRSNAIQQSLYISPNIEVKIADLGNACWENHHYASNIQTKQYRALEVIMGAGYAFPADMWSVGCLAFELATGEYLFNPKRTQTISSTEDHILLICELLGGIPKYIAQRGTYASQFFDTTGNLRFCGDLQLRIWKCEDVLVDKYKWKRVDAIPFAALVETMIEPDPDLRLTAADALNSEWLKETQ